VLTFGRTKGEIVKCFGGIEESSCFEAGGAAYCKNPPRHQYAAAFGSVHAVMFSDVLWSAAHVSQASRPCAASKLERFD
jgi:hypothetical protein